MALYDLTFEGRGTLDIRPIRLLRVDPADPRPPRQAVQGLWRGALVAFPTDTLYALGASVLVEEAVRRVYAVKGRPSTEPLPVLVASPDQAGAYAEITAEAGALMERFWPGALTLVLPRLPAMPAVVSGGRRTVALRMPDHPVALALIREAGVPLVGTSANSHGRPGPRTAIQVSIDCGDRIDYILDGGRVPLGRESTVLDLTSAPPRVVRVGAFPVARLREVVGDVVGE